MIKKLLRWLTNSSHVHARQHEISNFSDLIDLLDRFVSGDLKYPLEWDDFVSWENSNWHIEELRQQVASLEPLFFSKVQKDREQAVEKLLEVRDRAKAKLLVSGSLSDRA